LSANLEKIIDVTPFMRSDPNDASAEFEIGDVEIGVKYRFLQETESSPQIGIFPMAELPTRDSSKGLGNGKTWWRFPVWIQSRITPFHNP
jgi:hypothetical protein